MKHWFTYPLISHPYEPQFMSREGVIRLARAAEAAGFDGIGFTDHPAPSHKWLLAGGHDALDPFVALAVVAAATERLRLIPNIDGKGRVPAAEVLISTAFIRDCIMDKEKTHLIPGAIAQGTSQYGMQTFDQSIFGLYDKGLVSYEEALRWASNVDEFKLKVQGIATTADMARDDMARKGVQQSAAKAAEITRFGS